MTNKPRIRALSGAIIGVAVLSAGTVEATTPPEDSEPGASAEFIDENDYGTALSDAAIACIGETVLVGLVDTELGEGDFELLDEGHSLIMSGVNIFDPTLSTGFEAFECVRGQLELPEWTAEAMNRTTSMAGLTTVEVGDGYTVIWSYHPDNGPLVIVHDEDAG